MSTQGIQMSLRTAALIAGFVTLIMILLAPFAELYAYPRLVVSGNGSETVKNLIAHQTLFAIMIMAYALTFIGDIITAWALYVLLKPVNLYLSALAAIFRLVFSIIAIVSLLNLANAFRMANSSEYLKMFHLNELQAQIIFSLNAFRYGFHFGLIFFGIYLGLLGYLVWRSKYIPWFMGLLLVISGIGYFITSIQPYLFPDVNLNLAVYTFYGEVIFVFWLIIKGWKIRETR
jgi:hypothetical protein